MPDHTIVHTASSDATLAAIADVDVAFSAQITPVELSAARKLRWIHSPAAGVGSMLFPEMVASDVVMTNSRGTSAVTIAEHTIAVTLALLRNLPLAWRGRPSACGRRTSSTQAPRSKRCGASAC